MQEHKYDRSLEARKSAEEAQSKPLVLRVQSPYDEIIEVSTKWGDLRTGVVLGVVAFTMAGMVGLGYSGASLGAHAIAAVTGIVFAVIAGRNNGQKKQSSPESRILTTSGRESRETPRIE